MSDKELIILRNKVFDSFKEMVCADEPLEDINESYQEYLSIQEEVESRGIEEKIA